MNIDLTDDELCEIERIIVGHLDLTIDPEIKSIASRNPSSLKLLDLINRRAILEELLKKVNAVPHKSPFDIF